MKSKDDLKHWAEILQKKEKLNEMQPVTELKINLTTKEFREILRTADHLLEERNILVATLRWIQANTEEDSTYETARDTLEKVGELP